MLYLVLSIRFNKKISYPHTKHMPPTVSRTYPTTLSAKISRKTGRVCSRLLLPRRLKSTQLKFSTCLVCVPTSRYAKINTYLPLRMISIPSTSPKSTYQTHLIASILNITMFTAISKIPMILTCKLPAKDLIATIIAAELTPMLIPIPIPHIHDSPARASAHTSFPVQEKPHRLSKATLRPCLPRRTFLQMTVSCISANGQRRFMESRLFAVLLLPILVLFKSTSLRLI